MTRVFDQDFKDRAVRLVEDRIRAQGCSIVTACDEVAPRLEVSARALRQWLQKSRRENRYHIDEVDLVRENTRLRRENQEPRDTNEILKLASAFSPPNSTQNLGNDDIH